MIKGINYDVGTQFEPGTPTRIVWRLDLVRDELRSIAEDLNCNAVCLYGTDLRRLAETSEIALEHGLAVWLQPRIIDTSRAGYLEHLEEAAKLAERLNERGGRIVLNVGCELTLFIRGMLPGLHFGMRSALLGWRLGRRLIPRANRKLNALLGTAAARVRRHFGGEITYSSGLWEHVDWEPFDRVGLNQYRIEENRDVYVPALRSHFRHGKPVVVTEFGCGSYVGAARLGPSGHEVVDWRKSPPELKSALHRSEDEQAGYIADLLDIHAREGVAGAFVFQFIEPVYGYNEDSRYDLDRVGYGIVRVRAEGSDRPYSSGHREPKKAFHVVSEMYARM